MTENHLPIYSATGTVSEFKPARNIVIRGTDGRSATIDFSGPSVTFSGDLPVDDAAKQFFEAFKGYFR